MPEAVDANEIRPLSPATSHTDVQVSDRVDAYVNNAWWPRSFAKKDEFKPNYLVKLDDDGDEVFSS